MTYELITFLIIIDVGLTIINVAILGLAIKLYTDQTKQGILRGGK